MVKRGFYKHYKGHIYYVESVSTLKHENSRRIVNYTSVKTEEEMLCDLLGRDESEFEEWIRVDGTSFKELFPTIKIDFSDAQMHASGWVRRFERVTDPERSKV